MSAFFGVSVYPGTVITFIPDWLANTWRVVVWIGIMLLVARMVYGGFKHEQVSRIIVYDRTALVILLLASAFLDSERWGHPITWEGLPPVTVALWLTWRAVKHEDAWRKRHDKSAP